MALAFIWGLLVNGNILKFKHELCDPRPILSIPLCLMFVACVCSNFRNDVPRVAQRYGTIAAHTLCRASVLVVFVVFCVLVYSFAGFDKADATADVQ